MSCWFVYFLFYSFAGYGLEKLHAKLSHAPKQVRKCLDRKSTRLNSSH